MQGTPWSAPENYKKWAPMTYAAALRKFKTPTLVVGGERDYRVPYTQSAEFFQRVAAAGSAVELVIFRMRGIGVKPLNSQFVQDIFGVGEQVSK